jgi:hypothetical protein
MKKSTVGAALAAVALGGISLQILAKTPAAEDTGQASIAFVNSGSTIRQWEAHNNQGIWVQDAHQQWYYARLMAPCHGLEFAVRVGFETRGTNTLDRFSSVVVPGNGRCPIESLMKSDAPSNDR